MLTGLVALEFCRSWVLNGSYGLMITYMVKHLEVGQTTASQVTGVLNFSMLFSQLVGIALIRFLQAPIFLGISYVAMMVINIVFTFNEDNNKGLIWIWAILNGALEPSAKIALYSWFYQSISVTAFRTSLLLVGWTGGAMAGSALTGYMMTRYNPGWFIFTLDGILVCSNVFFGMVYGYHTFVSRKIRDYKLLG